MFEAAVISCDECKAIVCLQTDKDYMNFESTWYSGLFYQLCPQCKIKPQTQAGQLEDVQFSEAFERIESLPAAQQI